MRGIQILALIFLSLSYLSLILILAFENELQKTEFPYFFYCLGNWNCECCTEHLLRNKTGTKNLDSNFTNNQRPVLGFSSYIIYIFRNSLFDTLFNYCTLYSRTKIKTYYNNVENKLLFYGQKPVFHPINQEYI